MKTAKSFPLRRDLGTQVLIILLLFVSLVVLGVLLFEASAGRRLEADVRAASLALADAVAQETNTAMANALETVRYLADYPAVLAADPAGMTPLFAAVMHGRSDINLTYRLDADGIMRFHYPVEPESTVGVDFSFRDYFQQALASRAPLVSKGRISPTTNEPVATAVMPIWQGERFHGLVATNLRLQSLSDTLASMAREFQPDRTFQIFIVDATGQIIAHSDPARLLQDAYASAGMVITAVLNREMGSRIARDESGTEQLYSYVPITEVGWGVVVSQPTAVAFATVAAFRRGVLLAIAMFLVASALFWIILSRRVIQPIERLANFSQNVGLNEDADAQTEHALMAAMIARTDQMGVLTRSMQRMQQAIRARLNELSTLLDTSAAVVSSLDSETVLNRILEQAERLLDARMSAIIALDEAHRVFRVYASRQLPQWYVDQVTIDPQEPTSVTMRAIRSGHPIQISDTEENPSFRYHRARARQAGFRSVIAVPLHAQHAPPAALLLYHPEPHVFTEREIQLLTNFANHAAMAIENATLFARSDMQLQEQTRRLESLIQSLQDGLILENLEGQVLYANRRIEELTGIPLDAVQDNPVETLMARLLAQAAEPAAVNTAVAQALRQTGGQRRVQLALPGPDRPRHLQLTIFDVTDTRGTLIGRGRILKDITQRYEIDRMKSSLISTVSHELRTPLAAIKGYASTLLAEDVQWDDASQREFLGIISAETDHLSALVDDLLDMSRIEAGNLTVSCQPTDLVELVQQAALHAFPPPGERLHVDLPADLPPLDVDPKRMTAVLRNLIENGVKYGGGTPLSVTATVDDGYVTVRVADQGPGIPASDQAQIFNSFFRVDNSLTRQTTGAGLGLAISRGFVRAHGGDIWIEPRAVGTCVAFSLPLAPDWERAPAEVEVMGE